MGTLGEIVWLTLVFLLGASWGSYINVVAGRLPYEKSLLWPNSRCLSCFSVLHLLDNIPILGYLMRRGRCRHCGATFSSRYMWIELVCGLAFMGIFSLFVLRNILEMPFLSFEARMKFLQGLLPAGAVVIFLHFAVLFSFLFAAALCDHDTKTVPISLTLSGTVLGLLSATFFAWPYPNLEYVVKGIHEIPDWAFQLPPEQLKFGLYVWPVWGPLPEILQQNPILHGLATGFAGAAMGTLMVRFIKFIFESVLGKEALGLGDADFMMMAGAFVGWQVILVSLAVSAFVGIPYFLYFRLRGGDRATPFCPALAFGVMGTLIAWPRIAPELQPMFFDDLTLLILAVFLGGGLFVGALALRLLGFGKQATT
jgi:leader peptidase (prepilin peptidase) / N-methyltransferase